MPQELKENFKPTIDIVIVNWNSYDLLYDCIASIPAATCDYYCLSKVIIVDNSSSHKSIPNTQNGLSLSLIFNNENRGFASACNQGAAVGESDYILFLNPDARLLENSLNDAIKYMISDNARSTGICGVQLVDENGEVTRSCARFPDALTFALHSIGLDRIFFRLGHQMMEWDHSASRQVDHVIGAFYLIRRDVFVLLNGFDERFFVYLEDLDLSYRAKLLGWSSYYLADVQAFHAGGGSSRQIKATRLFYVLRSRILYAFKHFSRFGAVAVFVATTSIEPITRVAFAVARRSWQSVSETISAYRLLACWLVAWFRSGKTR